MRSGLPHRLGANAERLHCRGEDLEASLDRLDGVEDRLLVLLHVAIVRER